MKNILANVNSPIASRQLNGTTELRKILCDEANGQGEIERVVRLGLLDRLVSFLKSKSDKLREETVWVFLNVCCGETDVVKKVCDLKVVPELVSILRSSTHQCRDLAAWTLGNIAGDSDETCNIVLECSGLFPAILFNLKDKTAPIVKRISWMLSQMCSGEDMPVSAAESILPILMLLMMHSNDRDVIADVCWGLRHLIVQHEQLSQRAIDAGAAERLVQLIFNPKSKDFDFLAEPASACLGVLISAGEDQTRAIVDAGAVAPFVQMLYSPKQKLRTCACFAICNIVYGPREYIQAVIDLDGVKGLVGIVREDNDNVETKEAAVWSIANIVAGGFLKQIDRVIEEGGLYVLLRQLPFLKDKAAEVAFIALEVLADEADLYMMNLLDMKTHLAFIKCLDQKAELGEKNYERFCAILARTAFFARHSLLVLFHRIFAQTNLPVTITLETPSQEKTERKLGLPDPEAFFMYIVVDNM